jgi:hypothetical protein
VIASVAVHTTGVNWETVGVIVSLVSVLMTVIMYMFNRWDKRIKTALDAQTDLLMAKLETRETVSKITERLARVEAIIGGGANG